jgi:hypothetical protein
MHYKNFSPCPVCKGSVIDYGYGGQPPEAYVFAECETCGRIKRVKINDDTFYSLRLADAEKIAREAWEGNDD